MVIYTLSATQQLQSAAGSGHVAIVSYIKTAQQVAISWEMIDKCWDVLHPRSASLLLGGYPRRQWDWGCVTGHMAQYGNFPLVGESVWPKMLCGVCVCYERTIQDMIPIWDLLLKHVSYTKDVGDKILGERQPRTLKKVLGCAWRPGLFGVLTDAHLQNVLIWQVWPMQTYKLTDFTVVVFAIQHYMLFALLCLSVKQSSKTNPDSINTWRLVAINICWSKSMPTW